jgi:hypothetical protein
LLIVLVLQTDAVEILQAHEGRLHHVVAVGGALPAQAHLADAALHHPVEPHEGSVMNRYEEILQAYEEVKAGRLGTNGREEEAE